MAKLPDPDPEAIAAIAPSVVSRRTVLWRLHQPSHPDHPMRWDQLRSFGPLATARFDPWAPPPVEHPSEGVGYFGFDIPACLAEVFQDTRLVRPRRRGLQLSAFTPARPLRLLDLRGDWPVRIGASHAINSGNRDRCRAWAGAIRQAYGNTFDGLLYIGMAGRDCAVLYGPAADAFPTRPDFTKPLDDPGLASRIADACRQIGYGLD